MNRYIIILLGFGLISLFGCREEYLPDVPKYENILVVDGVITNLQGPYLVKLYMSAPINQSYLDPIPFSGCLVEIEDNTGNREILTEIEEGVYSTTADGIQGVIGREYKLIIQTSDEKVYESNFQKINNPIGINSVYAQLESQLTDDPDYPLWGYQFYLDTKESIADTNYFLWRTYGTYEYHSDYLIRYMFDGNMHPFYNSDSLYYCWKDDNINRNITASTANLSGSAITGMKLNYITTETRALSVRYSLLVDQYTLNEEAFMYYNQIQTISSEQSTLYATLPYQVNGNVSNIDNQDEPVLGNFLAAGIESKRVFVDRPIGNYHRYGICELSLRDYEAMRWIRWTGKAEWPLYITTDENYTRALPTQECIDCTKMGGVLNKPDFWID